MQQQQQQQHRQTCKPLSCVLNHPVHIYARGENPVSPNGQRAAEVVDLSMRALRSLPRNCSRNATVRQLLCQSAIKGSRRRHELLQSLLRPANGGADLGCRRRKSMPQTTTAAAAEARASESARPTSKPNQRSVSLKLTGGGGRDRVLAALSANADVAAETGPSRKPLFYCDDDRDASALISAIPEPHEEAAAEASAGWDESEDVYRTANQLNEDDNLTRFSDMSRNFVLLHSRLATAENSTTADVKQHQSTGTGATAAAIESSNASLESTGTTTSSVGYPREDNNVLMRKAVRFIDSFGLDLTYTKLLVDFDKPPTVPPEALLYLDLSGTQDDLAASAIGCLTKQQQQQQQKPASMPSQSGRPFVSACFSLPSNQSELLGLVSTRMIALESWELTSNSCLVSGIVRVKNLGYEKCVIVRVSFNSWLTFTDIYAAYVIDSSDGCTDRFSFSFVLPRDFSVGDRVEFCFRYDCYGSVYWDCNNGRNYVLVYFTSNPDAADVTNAGWLHFL